MTFIINQTLRTCCYPDKLKIARVRPLYKKDIDFCLKKEKNIHAQLVSYVGKKIFSDTQYGYRSDCSTEFASMELTDHIYNHLGSCQIQFVFLLDLSNQNIL